ncbi:MAG: DNA/RNA non-specific endonuclease [Lachnospiraceae bacterium]|nr:DNA/RNA non-specific endonuclease [Lachnospiraceae bacterium]
MREISEGKKIDKKKNLLYIAIVIVGVYVGAIIGSPKWANQAPGVDAETQGSEATQAIAETQGTGTTQAASETQGTGTTQAASDAQDTGSTQAASEARKPETTQATDIDEVTEITPSGASVVTHGSLYPEGFEAEEVPEYNGKKYVIINDGIPFFTDEDRAKGKEAFELYSALDSLGRCGTAYANTCRELMPDEKRGDISEIHPTGWKQKRYDGVVDADPPYLYNRSHLIAHKLAGEDANIYNLITGTRYFNADGMSYVEDKVYDYVKNTGNHVLYRITPVFEGDDLLAKGVLMEAESVEDDKISFCEFIYNVQPGVYIDYKDGSNHLE